MDGEVQRCTMLFMCDVTSVTHPMQEKTPMRIAHRGLDDIYFNRLLAEEARVVNSSIWGGQHEVVPSGR